MGTKIYNCAENSKSDSLVIMRGQCEAHTCLSNHGISAAAVVIWAKSDDIWGRVTGTL